MAKYIVTFDITGLWSSPVVDADNAEKAIDKAREIFDCAGFGEAESVEGEPVLVEDAHGNIVKEY